MASRGSLVMFIVTNHRERIETILSSVAKESEIYSCLTLENGGSDSRYFGLISENIQIDLQLAHTSGCLFCRRRWRGRPQFRLQLLLAIREEERTSQRHDG